MMQGKNDFLAKGKDKESLANLQAVMQGTNDILNKDRFKESLANMKAVMQGTNNFLDKDRAKESLADLKAVMEETNDFLDRGKQSLGKMKPLVSIKKDRNKIDFAIWLQEEMSLKKKDNSV